MQQVAILGLIALVAFSSRLFAVVRFESVIHEFDPWFNFRTTKHLVNNGYYEFLNWCALFSAVFVQFLLTFLLRFDDLSWYPLGRVVGGTVYPGLMVTSWLFHGAMHLLNIPIDIRNVCVFLAPLFSGLTALATFLMTRELKDAGAGLIAAAMIGTAS